MKTTTETSAATEKPRIKDDTEHLEDDGQMRKIDDAIAQCRSLLRSNNALFSERTKRAYEEDWENLRAQGKVEWIQGNIGYLMDAIRDIESYKGEFGRKLEDAVRNKWIGEDSKQRWWDRFNDPNTLEWTRKAWLQEKFPSMLRRWKDVAEKRTEALAYAKRKGVNAQNMPELATLFNEQAFLKMHFHERKNLVDKAAALIEAQAKNKLRFIRAVQSELHNAVASGYMHQSKVGSWMERVIKSDDPEAFATDILWPFMQNWKETRKDFDKLNEAMDKEGIPRGFRPVKENDFLLMDYRQRTSYCALAWIRMENAEELDKKLAGLKLDVRYGIDTEDFEGAEDALRDALAMKSDDKELQSMKTYIECHKQKDAAGEEREEEPGPQKLLDEARAILSAMPADMYRLQSQAAMRGPGTLKAVQQLCYNRVWVHEHNYSNEEQDLKNSRSQVNHDSTREYVENGHTRWKEHNILRGDTANEEAIREHCVKAQMLYVSNDGIVPLLDTVDRNKQNWGFTYWTSAVMDSVNYTQHHNVVKNLQLPLIERVRKLDKMGYRFTLTGAPEPKAAAVKEA